MQYFSTPPTNFNTGYYDKDEWFYNIIECCHEMDANEKLIVYDFGENKDLILEVYKDEDFNTEVSETAWDMVTITTIQDGNAVDDTENIYVTDGSLYKELERIWGYQEFATL